MNKFQTFEKAKTRTTFSSFLKYFAKVNFDTL